MLLFNNPELVATNIGFVLSAILTLGSGIFVLHKDRRKTTHLLYFLMTVAATVLFISHLIGINVADPKISRLAFMFNMASALLVSFNTHFIFAITGQLKEKKKIMIGIYSCAVTLMLIFLVFSRYYMLNSKPLLYFPNYYSIGPLYYIDNLFFFSVLIYYMVHLFSAYRKAHHRDRNRLLYFILAFTIAYFAGSLLLLPLYGFNFNPILAIFAGLFWTLPIAYGIIKEDLFDIRIVAKRAAIYLSLVIASSLVLVAVNFANLFLLEIYPDFPIWPIPVLSSVFGIFIGVLVWRRVRENDFLKYEFINVVTHKFRTPLTYIRLSLDELKTARCDEIAPQSIARIEMATNRLLELTNALVETAQSEGVDQQYRFKTVDLCDLLDDAFVAYGRDIEQKNLVLTKRYPAKVPLVSVDIKRMKSVFQILIENAIVYSRAGSTITVTVEDKGSHIIVSIQDEGIGLNEKDMPLIFSKFFRTPKALSTDTEGLGIGLYIAKNIVDRHGGKIWVKSAGENRGSTFHVELRAQKK